LKSNISVFNKIINGTKRITIKAFDKISEYSPFDWDIPKIKITEIIKKLETLEITSNAIL
jgi:hypothetical protein